MKEQKATNVIWHEHKVTREEREQLLKQKGVVIWFTGLSGSGKSTVANEVAHKLQNMGRMTYVLDGDNVRHGLNKDLGFTPEDRNENIRRISEVANLFADAGIITITAFISPYRKFRNFCRELVGNGRFIEIFAKASLETCEKRDPKGLYKKARRGETGLFTGISDIYEVPVDPDITLPTDVLPINKCLSRLVSYLQINNYL